MGRVSISKFSVWLYLGSIVLLILVVYSFFPRPIEIGGDAIGHWSRAENLLTDGGPMRASHHSMRWPITLTNLLVAGIFGTAPNFYYLGPFLATAVYLLVFSWLIHRLFGPLYALLFFFLYLIEPEFYRFAHQNLPSTYGMMALALLALAWYFYVKNPGTRSFVWVVLASFLLYGAKTANLFFLPGLVVILFLRKEYRHIFVFGAAFAGLYVLEGFLLNLATGWNTPLGRIPALSGSGYVDRVIAREETTHNSILDLLQRWTRTRAATRILHHAFFLIIPFCFIPYMLWQKAKSEPSSDSSALRNQFMSGMIAIGVSFAFFMTFFIVSINPIQAGMLYHPRYLGVLTPIAQLTLIWFIYMVAQLLMSDKFGEQRKRLKALLLAIGTLLVVYFTFRPFVNFSHFPFYYQEIDYNVWTVDEYVNQLVDDYSNNTCVVTVGSGYRQSILRALLPREQETALASNGFDFNTMEDNAYFMELDISEQAGYVVSRANVFSPDCFCTDAIYYDRYDIYIELAPAVVASINENLQDQCADRTTE